jgi:hypothetical protein
MIKFLIMLTYLIAKITSCSFDTLIDTVVLDLNVTYTGSTGKISLDFIRDFVVKCPMTDETCTIDFNLSITGIYSSQKDNYLYQGQVT